jgi:hypothetical protein
MFMHDTINLRSTSEHVKEVLERYENQIRDRWREKDILGLCIQVYAIVSMWFVSFAKFTGFDDPYDYLEHAVNLRKPTAKIYFRIGKSLYTHKYLLRDVDLRQISTPYMLLYLDKACKNHDVLEVPNALLSMSYREFKDYANNPTPPFPISKKPNLKVKLPEERDTTQKVGKEELEEYKKILREGFDRDMEIYILGTNSEDYWKQVKSTLKRLNLHIVKAEDSSVESRVLSPQEGEATG